MSPTATPRKQPRQARSRATVDRILTSAARIFDERGYRATTTNQVAAEAGISIGSLYQYFPNKDALLVALADRHVEDATAAFAHRFAELREVEPAVDMLIRSLIELTVELNSSERLHAVLFTDCPRTPEVTARLGELSKLLVDEIAQHLARAEMGGDDPRRRAAMLVSAVGAVVHEVVIACPPGRRRRAAVDDLVGWITLGLVARG